MRRPGILLLLAGLVLAGCVSAPSSGPVQPGLQGPVRGAAEPLVRPIANPPRPGMTQLEVVAGFLAAAAAAGDDYRVAREYLTDQAQQSWNPGAGATVMAPDAPQLAAEGDVVTARYLQVAAVTASGVLTQQQAQAGSTAFPMASVAGQWRIAQAPPGLLLSRLDLQRTFEVRNAYFVDPGGSIAVPDLRLVPRTGSDALATALVTALLAGPSPWLAPAVTSVIPDGLQLELGAVPVIDGVARVALQGPAITLDESAAQRLGAQFAWTLRQVPGLAAFDLSLNGQPVPLRDQRGPVPLSQFDRFDPDVIAGGARLYGLTPEGAFAMVAGDQVRTVRSGGADAGVGPASSIAVGPAGAILAGASADRTAMMIGGQDATAAPMQTIPGAVAAGPSIDARDRVWWTSPDGRVLLAVPDEAGNYRAAAVAVVDSPGPVRLVRPSRDGTRMALLIGPDAAAVVYLAVVAGDAATPRIEGLRPLGVDPGVRDLAWHSAGEVTALNPAAEVVSRRDLLGSAVAAFAVPDTTVSVTDAPADPVVAGLADGTAGPLTGSGVRVLDGLTSPAYPG